jgi:Uma2 family endonuclease
MMDDLSSLPKTVTRMRFAEFAAFYETRPHKQRWELIDGEAIMMPPPRRVHQQIAKNIERLLDAALAQSQPAWVADREIGIRAPELEDWAPKPDVTVADRDYPIDEMWAPRFYFVVDVLSDEQKDALEKKRTFYRAHAQSRGFMFVKQTEQSIELCVRGSAQWHVMILTAPTALITIPDIGTIGTGNDCYVNTSLHRPPLA